jgi:hypothetical protein
MAMISPKGKEGMRKDIPKKDSENGSKKPLPASASKKSVPEELDLTEVEETGHVPEKRFGSIFASIIPLNEDDKIKLNLVEEMLEPEETKELKYLLKTHKARFAEADFDTTRNFFQNSKYLVIACNVKIGRAHV